MPARIVVVHDHPAFVASIASALRTAGYDVATFADTMTAQNALDRAQGIDMLITRSGADYCAGRGGDGGGDARLTRWGALLCLLAGLVPTDVASHMPGLLQRRRGNDSAG